jgi:alpha-mannosidase
MVQIGDFNFGRKQDAIPRSAHPLLLAWPLNNYWDTNFAASQPGLIHLRYRFAPHSAFDPSWARREGQATAQRVLVHPLMTCPAVEAGTFFEVQGDAAANVHLLHAKPAADGQGVILRLVNLASSAAAATIALPGQQVRGAFLTTPAEVNVEALQSDEERFTVTLPSLRIMTIRAVLG